ncbi:MAG: CHAT domain-containing protein [Nostoc sp. DedSLP03]|uniref:CHAT domain-containing tetratricopeptide repeat protein n=1 Tax=Nostoc sp. DedSLP03 TaxID=3075400 RepID=UPI002AD1EAD9|nr:CHAT domain-containing protein [Nostoc sp. DedSLP03]MDZ7966375.1 CHAT domain-containing protein [Nostoc sp. DedSLP03]
MLNLDFNSFDNIQAAYLTAENERMRGNFLNAYDIYANILFQRLSKTSAFTASDTIVIQSFADLAVLFGHFQVADDLLHGLITLYHQAQNYPLAYFTLLKRINLVLDRGSLHQADILVRSLTPEIGNIESIDISASGLEYWETTCKWKQVNRDDQTILFAQLYLAMGRLLCANGQYNNALITLKRGLFYTGESTLLLARLNALPIKFTIVSAYLEKGELETTQAHLDSLIIEFDDEQQPEALVRWLELSAKLNLLRGQFGQALEKFQRVELIAYRLRLPNTILQATLNLAQVLISLNQISQAKIYLLSALDHAQASAGEAEFTKRIHLLLQIADARGQTLVSDSPVSLSVWYMRQRQQNETLNSLNEQEKQFFIFQSSNYLALFEYRVLLFHWLLSRFDLSRANIIFTAIKEAFSLSDSKLIQVNIQILEGILAYYQGTQNNDFQSIQMASLILDELRPRLKYLGLKSELWQVNIILGWCWSRLKYSQNSRDILAQETQNLLDELTESLSPSDQVAYLLNKWTADEEYIKGKINQLQDLQRKLSTTNSGLTQKITKVKIIHELLLRKNKVFGHILRKSCNFFLRPWLHLQLMQKLNALVEHIDRYKDALAKRTIKGDRTQVQFLPPSSLLLRIFTHPKNRVTLSFLILPDCVLIVKTSRFLFDFEVISTTRLAVRNVVKRWYQNIDIINDGRDFNLAGNNDYEQQMTSANAVGQKITDNLADILQLPKILDGIPKHIQALTIVPDDILHGFPFASVIYKGKYLIEHYALAIAYESKNKPIKPKRTIPLKKQALVIGISKGNKNFSSLGGVRAELQHINEWLHSHQINYLQLENNDAHKAAIIETISKASLLHIACHGTFEPNQPDSSGLVLISDSREQEILSLRELSEIDLTKLRHATLSSCWSADHFILPRRWIISLPETLWRAGTQSILGCLWQIDDNVAVSFMARFYNYLDNFPRDEALRRTQLDCLECRLPNCSAETANPLFWAGFNLYGDYRPLMRI